QRPRHLQGHLRVDAIRLERHVGLDLVGSDPDPVGQVLDEPLPQRVLRQGNGRAVPAVPCHRTTSSRSVTSRPPAMPTLPRRLSPYAPEPYAPESSAGRAPAGPRPRPASPGTRSAIRSGPAPTTGPRAGRTRGRRDGCSAAPRRR